MAKYIEPKYIDRGLVFPQPVVCEGMRLHGFILKGDIDNLQALCNAYLNVPAQNSLDYRPIAPYVMVSFATTRSISSGTPPYSGYGRLPEGEVAVWVPVKDRNLTKKYGAANVATQMFVPFMFVDEAWALIAGREIFGLPKEQGWIRIPRDARADNFAVDALAIKEFGPKAQPSRQTVIDVRSVTPRPDADISTLYKELKLAVPAFEALLFPGGKAAAAEVDAASALLDLIRDLAAHRSPNLSMVFLKQFRDIADGQKACYQAIVEAPVRLTTLKSIRMLDEYTIEVTALESHPIQQFLGLQLTSGKMRTTAAFVVECDYTIDKGTEIFKA